MRGIAPAAAIALAALASPSAAAAAPRVADFELRPAALHAAGGRVGVVSRPLRAPGGFDLVGMRWSSGAPPLVSLRTRRDGGRWSRWVRVASSGDHAPDPGSGERTRSGESDPLWVGRARWVQYRLSRPVGGLVLHFVRASPGRVRSPVRAAASTGQPDIRPRSSWDPGHDCRPRVRPSLGQVNVAFVHHTGTTNAYSPQDVPAMILSICRYHRNSNGWNDVGYNFFVDRFGTLWEGRAGGVDKAVVGAQTQGFNSQSTGISNLGSFDYAGETDAALSAMAQLIRWKLPLHGSPTAGKVTLSSGGGSSNRWRAGRPVEFNRVSGHRDANATDCPGGALYAQLPELRNRVGAFGPAPAGPPPALALTRPPSRLGIGRLLGLSGSIDPGKPFVTLVLDRQVKHRWLSYRRIVLGVTEGTFARKARLRRYGLYRAYVRFGGDGANGAARSARYRVRVPHSGG
ncbi:MAG: hypothetical protein QOD53_2196 [Thermoleophilaceae bacterium]|jgi:hypothetical protein|nr:hypothetical protein [Thermoleophilaceae bacterium]